MQALRTSGQEDTKSALLRLPVQDWPDDLFLIAFFQEGQSFPESMVRARLGADLFKFLKDLGLLEQTAEGEMCSTHKFRTWQGQVIAGEKGKATAQPGIVYTYTESTRILDAVTLRHPVTHAVDLGCGSGAIALRLADHADRVTAIDISPTAIALTRLNAALNGRTNITATVGDLLAPVQGANVDLVVGNLPFVLSPDLHVLMRDGDRPTDVLLSETVRGVAACLSKDGVAQINCNWASSPDAPSGALEALCRDNGLEGIVLRFQARSATGHSLFWNKVSDHPDDATRRETIRRWMNWLEDSRTEEVSFGVLTVWRANGAPRLHLFDATHMPKGDGGSQLARMITAVRRGPLPPDARPKLAPHTLRQVLVHDGQSYNATAAECLAEDSAGVSVMVGPEWLGLMTSVNGQTRMSDLQSADTNNVSMLDELWRYGFIDT